MNGDGVPAHAPGTLGPDPGGGGRPDTLAQQGLA